jgi:transposase
MTWRSHQEVAMRAYSTDLRQRVLDGCDAGLGTRAVAGKFSVSESWVRRLKQRRREGGSIHPRKAGNPSPAVLAPHHDALRELVARRPDATLVELRDRLADQRGVSVSVATLWRALDALRLTFKKSPSTPPSGTAPTCTSAAAAGWRR